MSGFSLLAGAGSKLQNSRLKSRSEIAQGGSFVRRESVFSSLNNSPIVHDLDAAVAEDNEVKTTTLATTTMMASQLTLTTQDSLMMSTVPLHMLSIDLSPIKGEEGGSLEPQAHSSVEADGHEQEAEDGKAAAVVVVGEDEDTVDRWAVVVPHNKTKNTDAQMRDVFTRRMLKQFVRATTLDQRRQKLNKIMKDANKESADKTNPRGSRIQPNFVRKQREFSRRLLCLTIIVFIVWGPFFVLVTYKQLSLKSLPSGLVWTTELLVHMASIINPIFTMFIPKFMQILMQPCRKCATRIRE
jgi:hypothetical protein